MVCCCLLYSVLESFPLFPLVWWKDERGISLLSSGHGEQEMRGLSTSCFHSSTETYRWTEAGSDLDVTYADQSEAATFFKSLTDRFSGWHDLRLFLMKTVLKSLKTYQPKFTENKTLDSPALHQVPAALSLQNHQESPDMTETDRQKESD